MDDLLSVFIEGTFDLDEEKVVTALRRGLNRGVERGKGEAQRRIKAQSSLAKGTGLKALKSGANALEAKLIDQGRPEPLASFSLTSPEQARKDGKVRLRVKPGLIVELKNAFFMKTKKGVQLVIRGKPGSRLRGRKMTNIANERGLFFGLSGPSEDQIFIPATKEPGSGVAGQMATWISDVATQEFFRQLALKKK